jgi:ABC-type nitrate/sulfonate/bicarbonate transport system substrate-binding protein
MQITKKWIIVIIVIVFILGCAMAWYLQYTLRKASGPSEPITIAIIPSEYSTLVWIAEDRGYFLDNQLNASLKNYNTGASSLDALSTHEADFSISSEYAFIAQVLNGADIRQIADIDKAENEYLIGRRDKGILTISDLKGKKIGVLRKGAAEFYLGRYLDLHGISLGDVTSSMNNLHNQYFP